MPAPVMGTDIAIIRQKSAAWIRQALDGQATPKPITSGATAIASWNYEIPFNYIANAGPSWPAPEGASGGEEFVEVTAANGVLVQYAKQTKILNGVTGTPKAASGGGTGDPQRLRFTNLSVGATVLKELAALQGTIVQCCIPIGENATTSEEGALYIVGKYSSAIEYDEGGEEVVAIDIEISGTSVTGLDAVFAWAPAAIIPLHADSEETPVTPPAAVAGDATALKSGLIVIK
jgi:hypothetical protein